MRSRIRQKSVSYAASMLFLGGRQGSLLFLIIAVLFIFFAFIKPDSVSGPRMGAADIFSPVLSVISAPFQNMAEAVSGVSTRAALQAENVKLKEENVRLREWYQTALMLQAENQSLQKLLNLKIDPTYDYITARVMSDAGNAFVKTLLVSSGQEDGIKKNQSVLSGEGLIGRIIEVGDNASRILLITDINSRVPVFIEGTSQKAILAGNNTDLLSLKHLPKDSGLVEGMRIITSGDDGVFPYGLPIGHVVSDDEGQKIIKPFADMSRLIHVRVINVPLNPNLIKGDLSSSFSQ